MAEASMAQSSVLSRDTVVVRAQGFIDAEIDNEIVALHIEKGSCYGLNPIGSRIWRFLDSPTRIRDICAHLVTEYEIDASTCERQVLDLLEELQAEGLIVAVKE
jgi:hypothetical protein